MVLFSATVGVGSIVYLCFWLLKYRSQWFERIRPTTLGFGDGVAPLPFTGNEEPHDADLSARSALRAAEVASSTYVASSPSRSALDVSHQEVSSPMGPSTLPETPSPPVTSTPASAFGGRNVHFNTSNSIIPEHLSRPGGSSEDTEESFTTVQDSPVKDAVDSTADRVPDLVSSSSKPTTASSSRLLRSRSSPAFNIWTARQPTMFSSPGLLPQLQSPGPPYPNSDRRRGTPHPRTAASLQDPGYASIVGS